MDGRTIGANGNVAARQASEEPMSMILYLGFSGIWSEILLADLTFSTVMHIDYVRVYQKKGQVKITCDPPGYPTTDFIEDYPVAYRDPNIIKWDNTGYFMAENQLMNGCS